MKTVNSADWNLLLEVDDEARQAIRDWASGTLTTRDVVGRFAYTSYAGEFRRLVRGNGTTYARRLARKALKYRGFANV